MDGHPELSRRRTLSLAFGGGTTLLAGCLHSDDDNEDAEPQRDELLLDRTVTTADGGAETITINAPAGQPLELEADSTHAAVSSIVDPTADLVLGASGDGVAHDAQTTIESEPVPAGSDDVMLTVAAHPDSRVDIAVYELKGRSGGGDGVGTSFPVFADELTSAFETAQANRAYEVVGPLWLAVLVEHRDRMGDTAEVVTPLQRTVYDSLVQQTAREWTAERVESVAEALSAASVTAVTAKTGLPAAIIQDTLTAEIETVLQGDRVTWNHRETVPRQLQATGGWMSTITDLELDLSLSGIGFTIHAPLELDAEIDAKVVPADVTVDDWGFLPDQISIR